MAWIEIKGMNDAMKMLSPKGFADDADKIAEGSMRRIGADAANRAPVDTGLLQSTMTSEIRRSNSATRGVWDLLQGTDYTLVQEYEHVTQGAFIRNAVWAEEPRFKAAIEDRFKNGR